MLRRSRNFYKTSAILGLTAVAIVQQTALAAAHAYPVMSAPSHISNSIGRVPAFMTAAGADAKTSVLFISDNNTNAVYLFDANNLAAPPLGKITDGINGPGGLAVDKSGVLYVASANGITLYRPGALHPFRTIHAVKSPSLVAVSADGTLAIAGHRNFLPGTLAIFDRGSPTPTRTIPIGLNGELLVSMLSLAVDASDNVVLSVGRYPDGGGMVRFAPGTTTGVDTGISPGSGEAFDARGNLYVDYGGVINVFAPGAHQQFRHITNGLTAGRMLAVSLDGRIFSPNAAQFDYGRNQVIPGNVVEYSQGPNPIATLSSIYDVDPVATAVRPAFP